MERAENPVRATPAPVDDEAQPPIPALSPDEHWLEKADSDQRLLAQIWTEAQPTKRAAPRASAAPATRQLVRTGNRVSEPASRAPRGEHGARIQALTRQLAECTSRFGPHGARALASQCALAEAHMNAGEAATAVPLLEGAIVDFEPVTPEDAAELACARSTLGRAYLMTRQAQKAIAVYETLLADGSSASTRSQLLGYRIKLAVAHRAQGDVTAAVDQLHALSLELASDSSERQTLLEAGVELATTNVVAGRPRDGVSLYENAVPLAIEVHGAAHRTTLGIRAMLARAHQQAGQWVQAVRLYEQLVSDAERAVGASDRLTQQARSELTALLRAH